MEERTITSPLLSPPGDTSERAKEKEKRDQTRIISSTIIFCRSTFRDDPSNKDHLGRNGYFAIASKCEIRHNLRSWPQAIVLWILIKKPKGKENLGRISFTKGQQRQHPVFLRTSQVRGAQKRLTCVPALYAEIFVNRGYPFQTLKHVITRDKTNPSRDLPQDPGTSKETQ